MKWVIVAVMVNLPTDTIGSDVFAFTQFPFPSKLMCETFLKKNQTLVTTISSNKWGGREVKLTVCLDTAQLDNLINGRSV